MKRIIINTGKVLLTIGLLYISTSGNAQDRKEDRQERKEKRKSEVMANFAILDSLLSQKSFVLEAYYLANRYGDRIPVSPTINFIQVNSTRGILQTGIYQTLGYNGVGGVTTEGEIGAWKIYKNFKNYTYTLHFSLHTSLGIYDINLSVTSDNHARAVISGLTPGQLIYEGQLQSIGASRVFKGTNTI